MTIADQIEIVRQNIDQYTEEAGRPAGSVRLLAVSKTHPASAIQEAYESGITEFGESYLQEALTKIDACKNIPLIWHFIGPIQSNKTRAIAENFDWVQSVDREKVLRRLSEQRPGQLGPLRICIQANIFSEPQKKGANPQELPQLLDLAEELPNIELRGLMVLPPPVSEFDRQLEQFTKVTQIFNELKQKHSQMDRLSMGMSGDIKAAIFAGSDMVRVGTGIFGQRKPRKPDNQN
ncbi:YggS family pyridoxal phosphate-dependent enzyme [Aliikangiella sp. G2MR2-5]|uniref:YggS family pyridoxal phosphate-dependent enzyme n=1 Tax=Aliikangiella sp. G2MR2-5 TaxID=2788943 RepID=UPI0018A96192|nr:YggS family pyridoxal phosphate-dependent enzyme [Aliikangiella sp. G2MR2-5]